MEINLAENCYYRNTKCLFSGILFDIVNKCSKRHQFLAEITWGRVSGLDKGPRLRLRA